MKNEDIWQKTLSNDEKVEYEFSVGERYIKFSLIIWSVLSLSLLAFGGFGVITFIIALFYFAFYLKKANIYAFTNKRVIIHRGWLSTHMISVDYSKITDIHIKENFIDRILTHTGTLAIITSGSTSDQIILKYVNEPYELKKKLDSLRD